MDQAEAPRRDINLPRDVQQLINGLPPDIIDAIHDLPKSSGKSCYRSRIT